jgi:hypothetical protein
MLENILMALSMPALMTVSVLVFIISCNAHRFGEGLNRLPG